MRSWTTVRHCNHNKGPCGVPPTLGDRHGHRTCAPPNLCTPTPRQNATGGRDIATTTTNPESPLGACSEGAQKFLALAFGGDLTTFLFLRLSYFECRKQDSPQVQQQPGRRIVDDSIVRMAHRGRGRIAAPLDNDTWLQAGMNCILHTCFPRAGQCEASGRPL
jgi:hypothetical protein